MTKRDIRHEAWAQHAPDYMIEVVAAMRETKDELREETARLNEREATLLERERAFASAVAHLEEYANRLFGPDSELASLKKRLDALEARGAGPAANSTE